MQQQQRHVIPTRILLKRFIPYFYKYKWLLASDLLAASLTTVCELVLPLIVRRITNGALGTAGALTTGLVLKLGALYILLRIIDAGANYYMQSEGHNMGAKIETDMRHDLFHHLQQLSFSFYNNTKVGQIMSRITSDLFDITEFAHHAPENFLISGIKVIIAFIVLSGMNIYLTLLIFAVLPFMIYFTRYFNQLMRKSGRECRHQVGEINAQVEDTLLGIRVVKSFANEQLEEDKFDAGNLEFLRLKRKRYHYMAGFGTSTRLHDGLMYIIVVVAGALFLIHGKIGVGDYTAYLLYVSTLLTSIRVIVDSTEQFQNGMTGIERFCEIMDAPAEIKDSPDAKPLENVRGEISFEHVGFHYNDDETHEVLSDLDLHVAPGQNVAVVGPSGGGKTTLCNLIPRFYDVTAGRITIDGKDIRNVTLESLRNSIGMVQQEVYMFSGTVADNIAYGKKDATREEVIEAARRAGADTFISQLPNGYDTYVGERGVKLSGGQKQRISIARVFLKNPPILVLDEATSALDNESERLVQESLEKLAHGRTTFTIAHRLTTIRNADVIWVLTEDGIQEQGTHKELMQKGGLYAQLYAMYTETGEVA
ncbi:MAG: ABC transporter ATP-binding protein [Clostridia bacterium]|nr:ABC transporter ATP-binding protein [Clostridia bacterium]MBR5384074.1 ABC transporter ATP-binding protein [Clostridia bacterium]